MIYIIGGRGYVGSGYTRYCQARGRFAAGWPQTGTG
jgi:hypothetical protein